MKKQNNPEALFSEWGKVNRVLPDNAAALKSNMAAHVQHGRAHASVTRRKAFMPWMSLALGAVGVVLLCTSIFSAPFQAGSRFESISKSTSTLQDSYAGLNANMSAPSSSSRGSILVEPREVPVKDDREFLKTDYSASIRSRNISDLSRRLTTTIRGMNGRVDSVSASREYGSISFVLPAEKLESFRDELQLIVGKRFVMETTRTENLLDQKRSLEAQQQTAEADAKKARESLDSFTAAYHKAVSSLEGKIASVTKQMQQLERELQQDPNRQAEISMRLQQLQKERAALQGQLASENSRYANTVPNLNAQLEAAEKRIKDVQEQDGALIDTVATVRGTLSLSWMSIWELVTAYVPGWVFALTFFAAAIGLYAWHRRASGKVPI